MGGIIAVTIRYSNGEELRESCWTNILPKGLFGWKFWVKDESEKHTREFWANILESRKKDKDLDKLWGRWKKLTPVEYGQIIVDYQKKMIVQSQGYTAVEGDHVVSFDHGSMEKFLELHARGLVGKCFNRGTEMAEKAVKEAIDKVKRVYHWAKEYGHRSGVVSITVGGGALPEEKPPVDFDMFEYEIKNWIPIKGGMEDKMKLVYDYARKNFKLTKTEERLWKSWFKEREE